MNKPANKPLTFDDYLATLSVKERASLNAIRKTIHKIVPDTVEGISYGLQAFLLNGKPFDALAANAQHCSYFPMSGSVVSKLGKELKSYGTSKGTIRFQADRPLPTTLLRKLVKARLAEIDEQTSSKGVSGKASKQTDSAVIAFLKALKHPLRKKSKRSERSSSA